MRHQQTHGTGLERADLEAYLVECGYWGNEELRRRNKYTLSPSVFNLSVEQQSDLDRLAKCTYAAVKKLNERLTDLAHPVISLGPLLNPMSPQRYLSNAEARFVKLANRASRSLLTAAESRGDIPPVMKVDLMQDMNGRFFIAEVDVYNPRGFGYIALLEESLPLKCQISRYRYPGISGLVRAIQDCQYGSLNGGTIANWHILVSEHERYYEPAFNIFARAATKRGLPVTVVREADVASGKVSLRGSRATGLLTIPDSLNEYPAIRDELMARYKNFDNLVTLYPPAAYLGSKAFLPYLRACDGMEEFIPPTVLVGNKQKNVLPDPDAQSVLKAAVSSGMKGVFFSDLDAEFAPTLESARKQKNASWILQEQVPQGRIPITVFDDNGRWVAKDYYLRITAYISENGVVDAEVTGRPDRKVHGAPDCIQLPVVLSQKPT